MITPGKERATLLKHIAGLILILAVHFPFAATGQVFPQDFEFSHRTTVLLDAGELWDVHGLFHPLSVDYGMWHYEGHAYDWLRRSFDRFSGEVRETRSRSADGAGFIVQPGIGMDVQAGPDMEYSRGAAHMSVYTCFFIHEHFYGRLYSRATNTAESLPHFTGKSRNINRGGLHAAELDQAMLGYSNSWMMFEFGRNREIWGPRTVENLILSGQSPSWERLMFGLYAGKFRFRSFYGFLETLEPDDDVNVIRYISGRALEFSNHSNFICGVGEVSIHGGINRPIDFSYLNPFNFHLEVDQNDRSNQVNFNYNNAIWFSHFDWLLWRQLRLTGSLIMDEFQLDEEDRRKGRVDSMGYLGRIAWTPVRNSIGMTLFGEYVRLNTYTYRHDFSFNEYRDLAVDNFVSRGVLLGHPIGNDADRLEAGIRLVFPVSLIVSSSIGAHRQGDGSMLAEPYAPIQEYHRDEFPSGKVFKSNYCRLDVSFEPFNGLQLGIQSCFGLSSSGNGTGTEYSIIKAQYQRPFNFLISDNK